MSNDFISLSVPNPPVKTKIQIKLLLQDLQCRRVSQCLENWGELGR